MDYENYTEQLFKLKRLGINPSLEPIIQIMNVFGNPQNKLKCIHIAGTNGKGSVCAMTTNVLINAGYKVGRYISPHLIDVRERFVINDEMIPKEKFVEYSESVLNKAKENNINLTFFELTTAICFLYFFDEKVDYAVIETGIGGTWDSTNIIKPLISVFTMIDLDHMEFLGDTIEKIAKDKSGIIKEKIPVVAHERNVGLEIIKNKSKEKNSKLIVAIDYNGKISLNGEFQKENAGIVYSVCQELGIDENIIQKGIKEAYWPARCEFIKDNLLIDGAHNPSGIKVLTKYVDSIRNKFKGVTVIFGCGQNKDFKSMLKLLPENDLLIFTQSSKSKNEPRNPQDFENVQAMIISNVKDAVESAMNLTPDNLIVCCGSLYIAGDVISEFKK